MTSYFGKVKKKTNLYRSRCNTEWFVFTHS